MKKLTLFFVAMSIVLLSTPFRSQEAQSQNGPQAQSKAEYDAYVALYEETEPQAKADLSEAFLIDYPESEFISLAFMNLISAYETNQDWEGVMDASDRFRATVLDADADTRRFVYPRAIMAAQFLNEADKIVQFGDLLLEVDPENLGAMLTLLSAITENIPVVEPTRERALTRATELAGRARLQARQFAETSAQRIQVDTTIHTSMARIHYAREDYENAAVEYVAIIRLSPRNGDAYYRLGDCYQFLAASASRELQETIDAETAAREQDADQATLDRLSARYEQIQGLVLAYMDRAIDSFATATAIGGTVGTSARQRLEPLYLARNEESTAGMDDLIDQKTVELNGL